MAKIYNRQKQKLVRRLLRERSTVTERLVWRQLRGKNLDVKVRRQFGIGPYIVDFFVPAVGLVIEIDGESHDTDVAKSPDLKRQNELEALGLTVVRFTDNEVRESLEDVIRIIKETVHTLTPPPPPPS